MTDRFPVLICQLATCTCYSFRGGDSRFLLRLKMLSRFNSSSILRQELHVSVQNTGTWQSGMLCPLLVPIIRFRRAFKLNEVSKWWKGVVAKYGPEVGGLPAFPPQVCTFALHDFVACSCSKGGWGPPHRPLRSLWSPNQFQPTSFLFTSPESVVFFSWSGRELILRSA